MGLKVKCFDAEHEQLLETAMNEFLNTLNEACVVDIKFSVSSFEDTIDHDQIFTYAAMVIYEERK